MLTVKIETDSNGSCGYCRMNAGDTCKLFFDTDYTFIKPYNTFMRLPSKRCPLHGTKDKVYVYGLFHYEDAIP